MNKMSKVYRRISALVVAVVMAMYCPVIAFAAESSEDVITNDNEQATVTEEGITGGFLAVRADDGIMPLSMVTYINTSVSNIEENGKRTGSFTMSSDQYLHWQFVVDGSCHLKITIKKYSLFSQTLYDNTVTNSSVALVTQEKMPQGATVTFTITAEEYTNDYALIMWGTD